MANINQKLNNLFANWQNQKKSDKIKDKVALKDNEKKLLKNNNLFDVNNDGRLDQEDVNLFLKGDINGDGKVSKEELSFVSLYKDDLNKSFNKQKIDFIMDGITYSGGQKATGEINGRYYKNGVLFTGKNKGKTYVYGNVLPNGYTYKINSDNKIAIITSKDGKTVKCCKEDGIIYSTITNNNPSGKPSIKWGDAVEFENSKTIAIRNGDTVVINSNKNVVVTSKDGKTKKVYDKNGNLYSTITNNNTKSKPSIKWGDAVEFENSKTMAIRNGDKAVINADGTVTVTSKDGKTVKNYDKNGNFFKTDKEYLDFLKSKGYDISNLEPSAYDPFADSIALGEDGRPVESNEEPIKYGQLSKNIKSDIEMLMKADELAKTARNNALKQGKTTAEAQKIYNSTYNNSVENQMVKNYKNSNKSDSAILSETSAGTVLEKKDGLYVNDGSKLVKLKMTKQQYLELFPPVSRFDTNQGSIGDCYFITGVLCEYMNNPKTYADVLQLFDLTSTSGDVTINFTGKLKNTPITFKEGKLYENDDYVDGEIMAKAPFSQCTGSLAVKYIEQAYALARFAQNSNTAISSIDMDAAYNLIFGGGSPNAIMDVFARNSSELTTIDLIPVDNSISLDDKLKWLDYHINLMTIEQNSGNIKISNSTPNFTQNVQIQTYLSGIEEIETKYSNSNYFFQLTDSLGNVEKGFENLYNALLSGKESESNDKIMLLLADNIQNGKKLAFPVVNGDIDEAISKKYGIISKHTYSIESIDTVNRTVNIINPWHCGQAVKVPYDIFFSCFASVNTIDI